MAEEPLRSLGEIREDIDQIDADLVRLLSERAALAQEVGRVKGVDQRPFFTPERERAIYARLDELNPGPLRHEQLVSIFREVISAARAAEKPLQVAFWGPLGTYTHRAALQTFGASTALQARESIADVFDAVERREVDYGVVPIENSVGGVVPETLDMFPQTSVKICAETSVPISHHLVSLCESLSQVKRVYAGPQPAAQCRRWLRLNLPGIEVIESIPTARAVERAKDDPEGAAIANRLAAELIGVPILMEKIEDNANNRTRFLVIGFNEPTKTGRDKTSFMFNLRNRPGELYRALGAFMTHGVNLMMIESRPSPRGAFEYMFYADAEGHRLDDSVRQATEDLRAMALECVVLGSYSVHEETR